MFILPELFRLHPAKKSSCLRAFVAIKKMKNKSLLISCILFFVVSFTQAQEPPELEQILEQINTINTFSDVYTGMVQVASFAPGKDPVVNAYTTYVKGLDNILMIQKAPKKDVGKKILLKKDKI